MKDVTHTGRMLTELTEFGVQIAMDDFGTGHSSLNYLKHFPIGRLKIDQSFVAGMTHDEKDKAIVATIISMASNLGLDVTAGHRKSRARMPKPADLSRTHRSTGPARHGCHQGFLQKVNAADVLRITCCGKGGQMSTHHGTRTTFPSF